MSGQNYRYHLKQHFFLFNHKKGALLHPVLLFAGATLLLVLLFEAFKYSNLWANMALAAGNTLHFCEFNHEDLVIKQIANTWSNLAYLLVGFILISIGVKDHLFQERHQLNNFIARHPGFTFLLGIAMIYLFFGSFFYHASLTKTFQLLDVGGIYAVVIALLCYNFFRAFPSFHFKNQQYKSHYLILSIGILLNILVLVEIHKWNINTVFPILIVGLLLLHVINMRHKNLAKNYTSYIWLASSSMAVAAALWILDRTNILCSPTSIFQGHAFWHMLTALAVLMTYLSYRTEVISEEIAVPLKS
jgi:hypothetical protein